MTDGTFDLDVERKIEAFDSSDRTAVYELKEIGHVLVSHKFHSAPRRAQKRKK